MFLYVHKKYIENLIKKLRTVALFMGLFSVGGWKMTDLQRLIALILPEFLEYLESSEKPKKGLDKPSNPSIACDQGGKKND